MKTNPPSIYDPFDRVLVRVAGSDSRLKRGGKKLDREVCKPAVIQRRLPSHKYVVKFADGTVSTIPVRDLTDVTREGEKKRQKLNGKNVNLLYCGTRFVMGNIIWI